MGLRTDFLTWWPEIDFYCKKCKTHCDGKSNSLLLADCKTIARWCDACGFNETGTKDSFSEIDESTASLNLDPPGQPDLLINSRSAKSI